MASMKQVEEDSNRLCHLTTVAVVAAIQAKQKNVGGLTPDHYAKIYTHIANALLEVHESHPDYMSSRWKDAVQGVCLAAGSLVLVEYQTRELITPGLPSIDERFRSSLLHQLTQARARGEFDHKAVVPPPIPSPTPDNPAGAGHDTGPNTGSNTRPSTPNVVNARPSAVARPNLPGWTLAELKYVFWIRAFKKHISWNNICSLMPPGREESMQDLGDRWVRALSHREHEIPNDILRWSFPGYEHVPCPPIPEGWKSFEQK